MYYYRLISSMLKAVISSLGTSLYSVYKGESNANDSLATYNGTAVGGVTYTSGKSGNAFTFNGTTGLVALPNSSFDFTSDFSISTWVKITANPSGNGFVFSNYNYDTAVDYGYLLRLNVNRTIAFLVCGTNGVSTATSTTVLALNTWYHVTIKRDITTKTSYLYVNVTLEMQVTNSAITLAYGTRAIQPTIGAIRGNNNGVLSSSGYFDGSVDELNIWNKQLTSTEVTDLYNTGTGKFYPY